MADMRSSSPVTDDLVERPDSSSITGSPTVATAAPNAAELLSGLPPIFLLVAHLGTDALVEVEQRLGEHGASVTYDHTEASIFVGRVNQQRRAIWELSRLGVATEAVQNAATIKSSVTTNTRHREDDAVVLSDSSTESEPDSRRKRRKMTRATKSTPITSDPPILDLSKDSVVVVKVAWLEDSIAAGQLKPMQDYMVYHGKRTEEPTFAGAAAPAVLPAKPPTGTSILARARAELGPDRGESSAAFALSQTRKRGYAPTPHLVHETTAEHDAATTSFHGDPGMPPAPEWITNGSRYACERRTPRDPPNFAFIKELLEIRFARILDGDIIGERAYSTGIAALAAYPYEISSAREVLRLPGCENKFAALWAEWASKNRGSGSRQGSPGLDTDGEDGETEVQHVEAVREVLDNPSYQVLRLFYDIWGVGAKTAREFYDKGWRDLDDVIEQGWSSLIRTQQIGLKYYEEFKVRIPRAEVEIIASHVKSAAEACVHDPSGIQICIVGGHRRGQLTSGDVDVIVSHRDQSQTLDLIEKIVKVLGDRAWVTHSLTVSTSGSRRGQASAPVKASAAPPDPGSRVGFDTLDKALVVWQDPHWDGRAGLDPGLSAEDVARANPNIHRRVDIIVAPWSKVGCAIVGWSGGTTFERDLRRYVKARGWKFDSSGVRDRATGAELDLEGGAAGPARDFDEAERRVFAGLGLTYRPPEERCTF